MTDRAEFSVFEFYPDGSYSRVRHFVSAREAVEAAKRVTEKPAVQLSIITRVIITDGDDACVFEWKHGKGVTFPRN